MAESECPIPPVSTHQRSTPPGFHMLMEAVSGGGGWGLGGGVREAWGVSAGGAKGVDAAAMPACGEAGGIVIGILAADLLRSTVNRQNRQGIQSGQLVLISPFNPEAGFNAGSAMARNRYIYALADFAFEKALVLPEQRYILLQVTAYVTEAPVALEFYSCPAGADGPWPLHARGMARRIEAGEQSQRLELSPAAFQSGAETIVAHADHYQVMGAYGLDYGPSFQGIGQLWSRGREAMARLHLPEAVAALW